MGGFAIVVLPPGGARASRLEVARDGRNVRVVGSEGRVLAGAGVGVAAAAPTGRAGGPRVLGAAAALRSPVAASADVAAAPGAAVAATATTEAATATAAATRGL